MKFVISILFLIATCDAQCQWHQIRESDGLGGESDLFFLNADSGFVIGGNTNGSFILRTHDGGTSWDSLWYEDHIFETIFFSSVDTGYISCFYENQVAVMRSIDGGDSWQLIASNLFPAVSIPYAISFFNNDTGIISIPGWWAVTYNAGVDWNEITESGLFGTRDSDIDSTYYFGIDGAILIWGNDEDYNFNRDTLNYQGSHYYLKARDHRFISSAIGYEGNALGFPQYSFGIITIGDALTQDWQIIYFPNLVRVYGVSWPSENIMYAVHNLNYTESPDQIKFFMKSIDGGQTWHRQGTVEPGYYGTQQIFCPNDSVCYAIGGGGMHIYKTTNGGGPLLEEVTQVPLSVAEIKDDLNFSMAPNPTTGRVTIKSEKEQIKRIEVFDLQGKSVLTNFPKAFEVNVDLTAFPAGVYLVQVLAGDKILTGKIVVE